MWSTITTLPFQWCSTPTIPFVHQSIQDVTVRNNSRTVAILDRRQQRHQQRLIRRYQTPSNLSKEMNPDEIASENPRTTIPTCCSKSDLNQTTQNSHAYSCKTLANCCHLRSCNFNNVRHSSVNYALNVICDTGPLQPNVSDLLVTACATTDGTMSSKDEVPEMSRWTKCLRVNSAVGAGWRFILGVVLVLQALLMTGVRRFLARFSGRRRLCIPSFLRHHKSSTWRILAFIVVSTSLINLVDGCSSRNTPKPRPPPTPATAAATTARPNITFLTYECPPAYAAWYCLNGATCFTVKIGDSLLYNCECSEGYMGPRCEYKDLDGSYLPSQRRILLETASIAGGATIAVLLVVVLGLVAYVHYCRRQRKEEPPTPPTSLTAAQSTLTTTTDTVDGVTRTVTTSCVNTQVPRRLPTFGTRWKTQNQQQQQNQEHSVAMTRVDLQQVTTLLGDCDNAQTQQTHAQLQRQC